MRFFEGLAAFKVVAAWAGSDNIFPNMQTAEVSGYYVVYRERSALTPAVLAGVLITLENLLLGEMDRLARLGYHSVQTDNGWDGIFVRDRANNSPSIHDQECSLAQHKLDRAAHIRDVDGLIVSVQDQHSLSHEGTTIADYTSSD